MKKLFTDLTRFSSKRETIYASAICFALLISNFAGAGPARNESVAVAAPPTINFENPNAVSGMKKDSSGVAFDWGYVVEKGYLTYDLDFAAAGSYPVVLEYSNPGYATGVNLYVNGNAVANVSFASTGSYSKYTKITTAPIAFPAGKVTFTIQAGWSGFNLAGASLSGSAQPTPTPTPTPAPGKGGRNYIMGIFEDSTDTTTINNLGYKFDYTINGSYQDPCAGCGVSGISNYPIIIDLKHINPGYADFNVAASGGYNSDYAATVQSVAKSSGLIYAIRMDSEFNGAWSQWSPWYNNYNYNNGVSPATWIAGYRNLALMIRKYMPNTKIIWNPNTGQGNPMAYYPGDDVTDIIGIDIYTFYQYYSSSTAATNDQMSGGWGNAVALAAFAKQHGKPFGFPEWGDTYGDGVFITAMGNFINNSSNNVVFHSFWDSNQAVTGSSRLTDHPANEAAYVKAFGGKKYNGTYWKTIPVP